MCVKHLILALFLLFDSSPGTLHCVKGFKANKLFNEVMILGFYDLLHTKTFRIQRLIF